MKHGGLRRNKADRADATSWMLANIGLQRYDNSEGSDDKGVLRNFGNDERDTPFHNSRGLPAFPILPHGNLVWMFRKLSDVSSDSWVITEVGSGTQLALQDERGGVAKFITGSADNNYQQYVAIAESMVIPGTGVSCLMGEIKIDEPVQSDMFFGFCEKGVDIFDGRQNSCGFYSEDGSAIVKVETNIAGDARIITSEYSLVAGTWHRLGIGIQCDASESVKSVNFFIDGEFIGRSRSKMPTAAMALSFGLRNGDRVVNGMSVSTAFQLND